MLKREERYLLNDAAVRHEKVLVECAMYGLTASIFTVVPGETACLRGVVPEKPTYWKREFPVFGAVSGAVACLGAMEVIKTLSGLEELLRNRMMLMDLESMDVSVVQLQREPDCPVCGGVNPS